MRRERSLRLVLAGLAAGLAVGGTGGCSAPRDDHPPSSPAASSDLPGPDAAEDPEGAESTGADALASVEAELAEYEARLAKVGVTVQRGTRAQTSAPTDAFDDRGPADPTPEAEPLERDVTVETAKTKPGSAKRPASRRPTRSKDAEGKSRRERQNKAGRKTEAPPPPSDGRPQGQGAAPGAAVGGALADEDGDASVALGEAVEGEEEASRIDPKPRCEELCTLADAICALEERVCSLADEHAWDQRYADACTRAGEDCVAARDACSTCRP